MSAVFYYRFLNVLLAISKLLECPFVRYICSALCKSTALTLPLALIVLDAILGTFSTSFTATIRNPNGSNSKNNKAVASNFLLQFKAAFWCIGRALDLLAFMLAFVWRAREANISHDNDER